MRPKEKERKKKDNDTRWEVWNLRRWDRFNLVRENCWKWERKERKKVTSANYFENLGGRGKDGIACTAIHRTWRTTGTSILLGSNQEAIHIVATKRSLYENGFDRSIKSALPPPSRFSSPIANFRLPQRRFTSRYIYLASNLVEISRFFCSFFDFNFSERQCPDEGKKIEKMFELIHTFGITEKFK